MNNLPEKADTQNVALAIYNAKPGTMAIDIRRKMVQLPEVANALTPVEKYIFAASTKTQISEMDDGVLASKTAQMFRFIAMDVGYIIPQNENDWAYIQTRLVDILKRYYSYLTLADIKLAFELATTGELDEFLPLNSQGNPDKKHYQQFNADYFAKILGAYRKKQNEVIGKAYKALPEPNREMTPKQKRYYHNCREARNRIVFLQYKYTGKISFEFSDEMFLYDWLLKFGFADEVEATEDDRKQAFTKYMHRAAIGMVNQYTAFNVRRKGIDSPEIDFTAYEVARKKEIIRAFNRIIAEEIQIDNYLFFI
jgi:hypothetical protein|nr:MAG TPA: hypothetical protein [Caudoviricetes sp.]